MKKIVFDSYYRKNHPCVGYKPATKPFANENFFKYISDEKNVFFFDTFFFSKSHPKNTILAITFERLKINCSIRSP